MNIVKIYDVKLVELVSFAVLPSHIMLSWSLHHIHIRRPSYQIVVRYISSGALSLNIFIVLLSTITFNYVSHDKNSRNSLTLYRSNDLEASKLT